MSGLEKIINTDVGGIAGQGHCFRNTNRKFKVNFKQERNEMSIRKYVGPLLIAAADIEEDLMRLPSPYRLRIQQNL